MKLFVSTLILVLFSTSTAFAYENVVPEFFYQPELEETAVEGGVSYSDSSADNANEQIGVRGSVAHGLTHNLALRLGTSYTLEDDADGFNNLNSDIIGHNKISGSFKLYYGVFGSLTPDKGPSTQRFSSSHSFSPYIGVSTHMDNKAFGARFLYNTVSTSNDVLGNFSYDATVFGEMNVKDSYLAGASLDYNQLSQSDADFVTLNFYGRVYLSNFTLLPRINYGYALDSQFDDSYAVELAARFLF